MNAARAWWVTEVPAAVKLAISAATGFGAAIVMVGAALDIPARVSATEAVNTRQSSDILELQIAGQDQERRITAADLRSEVQFRYTRCLLEHLSGEGRKTPGQCANDFANEVNP